MIVAVAAACAAAATTAGSTQAALKTCGVVKASGFAFHVFEAKLPNCVAARALTLKLARKGFTNPGIRPYSGSYLSMHCFGAAKGKAAQIQCTSNDGKKSLYAVAKP